MSPTAPERRARRRRLRHAGFTLLEVLAALGLVAAVGMIATSSGHALARLAWAARGEAAGLLAGERKIEELLSLTTAVRRSGADEITLSGIAVRRVWRVRRDAPARGLSRIEVSTSWEAPDLTILTLVAVGS